MIARCPRCGSQYVLTDELWAGRSEVQGRCRTCHEAFTIAAPFANKPAVPDPEEATPLATPGDYLQLPKDKIVALSVTEGPQKGEVFHLNKPRVLIGRKGADVVLNDPQVSRKHCVIEVSGDTARVIDLGTTNGTAMNGEKITHSCELEHLSEVRVGTTSLLYTVRATE